MKRYFTLLLLALGLGINGVRADGVFVEAENFENKGGWQVDQQFMDVMGSPYLIAHGIGAPVQDATTEVDISAGGKYYVYARTYNWTSPWSGKSGPGKFSLTVGGKKLPAVLGCTGSKWEWQLAGNVNLKAGKTTLRLHDFTGFDGRCDAIWMSTKPVSPPEDKAALSAFRKSASAVSAAQTDESKFDLVVVGGGIAGISAAVSGARLGLKVALVHDRPVLGGNNSSEVRVHLGGRIDIGKYPHLGGLQKEFGPTKEGNAMPASNYADDKKLQIVRQEPNISLLMNWHVNQVQTKGGSIESVIAQHTMTGKMLRLTAPLYADCTGDGTVGYLAGADFLLGRESREAFEEPLAPLQADSLTMGASVQWYSVVSPRAVSFPEFDYGVTFTEENSEKVYRGDWTWETGLNKDQINDFERIRDYGMLVVYSNWSFLKNHSAERKDYRNRKLEWVAYIAGKRETRRLLGDYVLSEQDLVKGMAHEDASFTTTWSIDLHYPDSLNGVYFPDNEFKAITRQRVIYPYAVPYRCLYSRNINNLFMAGRNISVTHVALGSTRVMRTTGMMGEVVGMAAAICHRHNALPRAVYTTFLSELKELMKKGIGGQGLPNNQQYNEGGILSRPPVVK